MNLAVVHTFHDSYIRGHLLGFYVEGCRDRNAKKCFHIANLDAWCINATTCDCWEQIQKP